MIEKSKNRKRGSISEDDVSALLGRYKATTVLSLLQEVAQSADAKIDWNALVKKTSTGISDAREYQMLWRHLAYRHSLLDKLEDGAEPLDDDSDLEYELEASPAVSCEASTEAAACVKVLIASGLASDSSVPNSSTIEASLIISIPNGQPSRNFSENSQPACSVHGTHIAVPVSVLKQPLPSGTSAEGLDANGAASSSLPPRKKRKPWTEAEDMELIAAVQKRGEGSWANILKGDFKGDRTASQLSQRWAIIKKRCKNLDVGGAKSNGPQISEAQLATRRAMSMALNMPIGTLSTTASTSNGGMNSNTASGCSTRPTAATVTEAAGGGGTSQSQNQSQHGSVSATPQVGPSSSTLKSRATSKKVPTKSGYSSDSMLKATAVAAGARIATQNDAAALIKSANAVHIMGPGGGSLIKSSLPGGSNSASAT
ncbi:uncharacterized protein LOC131162110 [Malania oleifera]|uniref:uncharacterized protein LOC131162110 n=1 Tax=Malania oleifera TaxID=397392 RepID=UPI0025AE2769|nr:uncharacterized protein LOC131162110 [Malania oleifera]XP_057974256.1 uncharacterized protein LOC131162110 [Malania oleifera]